jgi:8-oxo-dGTP diphosphatase
MRVEEVVGLRIKDIRESRGLTQDQLGELMGELLGGRPWARQTVSAAEHGRRAFTAAELVACSLALGAPVGELLTPLAAEGGIELSPGRVVDTRKAMAIMFEGEDSADLRAALMALIDHARQMNHSSSLIIANARFVLDNLARVVPAVKDAEPIEKIKEEDLQPVATAIVTSARGVLVGRRQDGKPPWTFIAGEVEPGETAPFAAGREVKEETGLEVEPGEVIGERVHPKTGRTMIYVAARPVRPDDLDVFVGDERELAEVRWVSLAEADELMQGYGMFEPVREHLARTIGEGR